jgi:hypothetical protein
MTAGSRGKLLRTWEAFHEQYIFWRIGEHSATESPGEALLVM